MSDKLIPIAELRHRVSMLTVIACEGAESDLRTPGIVQRVLRRYKDRFEDGTWNTHYTPREATTFVATHLSANLSDLQFIVMEYSSNDKGTAAASSKQHIEAPSGRRREPDRN